MEPMSLKDFRRCKRRDFDNGAVMDEIDAALEDREKLLAELFCLTAENVRLREQVQQKGDYQ